VLLDLQVPEAAGNYLLLLDVLTPESGPMSALGSAPAIIRVTVNAAAPTPVAAPTAASPTPTPTAAPRASASSSQPDR
jgi:hypothetical protein